MGDQGRGHPSLQPPDRRAQKRFTIGTKRAKIPAAHESVWVYAALRDCLRGKREGQSRSHFPLGAFQAVSTGMLTTAGAGQIDYAPGCFV